MVPVSRGRFKTDRLDNFLFTEVVRPNRVKCALPWRIKCPPRLHGPVYPRLRVVSSRIHGLIEIVRSLYAAVLCNTTYLFTYHMVASRTVNVSVPR